jgi:hypothetical protein
VGLRSFSKAKLKDGSFGFAGMRIDEQWKLGVPFGSGNGFLKMRGAEYGEWPYFAVLILFLARDF